MNRNYVIDGYSFASRSEYERAQKEKETVLYLSANTNMADMKAVYKIYKQAVEKKSFRTVFGLRYLENLRERLIGSEFVTEDLLEPIPVVSLPAVSGGKKQTQQPVNAESETEKYQKEAQKVKSSGMIKNFLIAVLVLIIGVMIFITYKSQYSVFTYFTNYKENMRNELVDEYEDWTNELEEKESRLEQREKKLEQQEKKAQE